MRTGDRIGIGVIGCGHVAGLRHLPALAALPSVRVAALADPDRSSLDGLASRYDVPRRYAGAEALIDDPAVEVVAVLVPAALHAEVLLPVLEAEKHALVEKPLALSRADCDRMVERAARSPVKVTVGFNLRAHRLVRRARELLAEGLVGPVESVEGALVGGEDLPADDGGWRGWRFERRLGGGALFEKGAHHFDLWRLLAGGEAAEVSAISRRSEPVDRSATVSARMANGALASATLGDCGPAVNRVTVTGPEGCLELSMLEFDGLRFIPASAYPGDARTRLRAMRDSLRELPRGLRTMRRGGEYVASYGRQWELFIDAVRDHRPVRCSLEDGRRALEIALAAAASAARGRSIGIEDVPADLDTALRSDPGSLD